MKAPHTLMIAAATTAMLFGLAGPAQAAPPPTQSFTLNLPGTDSAGNNGFCTFPVRIDEVSHQRDNKSTGPNGATVDHFTGNATATVTNTTTGKKLSYNISGPGTVTSYPDGSFTIDAAGPNLLWTTVANSYPGVPQIAYTHGHVQVSVARLLDVPGDAIEAAEAAAGNPEAPAGRDGDRAVLAERQGRTGHRACLLEEISAGLPWGLIFQEGSEVRRQNSDLHKLYAARESNPQPAD
jgi:hypothetical protein